MIAFELSMPNRGSWNNKWSLDGECFVRVYDQRYVPKKYWNRDFFYHWDDGWTACVSVCQVSAKVGNMLRKKSKGFLGYDWMIRSILDRGEILTEREVKEREICAE